MFGNTPVGCVPGVELSASFSYEVMHYLSELLMSCS